MGQPLGVAIIGGGSSDRVRKARGLGRQVWPSLKSLSTQLLEAAAARHTLRSPSLRHGRGLEADTPAILRMDLADILAEAVAAGGGEAGSTGGTRRATRPRRRWRRPIRQPYLRAP